MTKQNTYRLRTVVCTLTMVLGLLLYLSVNFSGLFNQTASAAPVTYLNFQARLKTSSGSVVPDGIYNIEFKIYSSPTADGGETPDQGACTVNGGSADEDCIWVETRSGGNKVRVVNGYFSVSLGSVSAFSGSIDWSQEKWITMNIGGTASPSWDGEMTNSGTRMILTAVPYAFQAGQATKLSTTSGGFTSQLQLSTPTGNRTITAPDASGTILLDSTVTTAISDAAFMQGGNSFSDTATLGTTDDQSLEFITDNSVRLTLSNAGAATFRTTTLQVQNTGGTATLLSADTSNMRLTISGDVIAGNSATATTATTSGTGTDTTTLVLTGAAFADNDVVFIDNAGQDYFTRIVSGGGTNTPTVSPAITYENAVTVTKYNVQNLGATSSDYTNQSNRFYQGYFLGGIVTGTGSTIYADGNITSSNDLKINAGTIYLNADVQFKNGINSSTAFQLQNSDDVAIFTGNTDGLSVQIGSATTDDDAVLLITDSYEDGVSGDPAGVNGAIYYNTDLNKFRCYEGGNWVDCVSSAGGGANVSLSNLSSVAINTSLLPGNTSVDLGSGSSPFRDLYLGGTATNNFKITGTASAPRTLTLPDEDGVICTSAGTAECLSVYSGGGGGGITSVGAIDTQTKHSNGAVISGSSIYLQTADVTSVGLVSASTQTFGGNKTFDGTVTLDDTATFNGSLIVSSGQTLTNAGSLLLTALSIGNKATGGDIGTAAATVDVATSFNVNQTTASQILTLPAPTSNTAGRVVYVSNVGSAAFSMYGVVVSSNNTSVFYWNGTVWSSAGIDGSGANYIQNQGASDQTGDFRISGVGRANTSLQAPILDRYDSGTLTIGGTNATAISLADNTTVNGTLTVVGGAEVQGDLTTHDVLPASNNAYDLGSSTSRYRDLYLGPDSLHIGADGDEGTISYDTTHDTFDLDRSVRLSVDTYINFGTISGVSGYGIRDNGGVLEVKDAGGSWVSLTGLGSGGGGGGGGGGGSGNVTTVPTVQSYTTYSSGGAEVDSVPLQVPTGTTDGDLLVAMITRRGEWATRYPTSVPSGWTAAHASEALDDSGSYRRAQTWIYYKVASSDTPGATRTWTMDGTSPNFSGTMLRISGANQVQPIVAINGQSVSATADFLEIPALTTPVDDTLGLSVMTAYYGTTTGIAFTDWSTVTSIGSNFTTIRQRDLTDADAYAAVVSANDEYISDSVVFAIAPISTSGIYPGVATFQDDFNDNSLDGAKWASVTNGAGASISESTQQLKFNVPSTNGSYAGVISQNAYSMLDKWAGIEFVGSTQPGHITESNFAVCDSADPQLDTCLMWSMYSNTIEAAFLSNGSYSSVWSGSYNGTTHKYWRIREAAGVSYWETSADNDDWTARFAIQNLIDLTSVKIQIFSGNLDGATASSKVVTFDNMYLGTSDRTVNYSPASDVVLQGGNLMGTTLSIGTLDAYNFNLLAGGATVVELDGTDGSATFHNSTNSVSAFQVQNSLAGIMFNVDTANSRVYIGDPSADSTGVVLVLDTKNDAGDPTGVNGAMYYNSDDGKFRCYEDGVWRNCITDANNLTLGDASNAGTVALSDGSSNTVSLTASGVGSNYTLKLPTTAGSTTECLRTDSVDATQLVFGSCAAAGGDGGVLSLGALDGQTANGNGGSVQGTLLYQQSASATNPGLVNTTTQTFAGNKTFSGTLTASAAATFSSTVGITGAVTINGNGSALTFSGVDVDITTSGNQDLTVAPNGTGNVVLGVSDTTGTLLVLDTKTGSGDPSGVEGGMYYNSNMKQFRCYSNSVWRDCYNGKVYSTADVTETNGAAYTTAFTIPLTASKTNVISIMLVQDTGTGTVNIQNRARIDVAGQTGSCKFTTVSTTTAEAVDLIAVATSPADTAEAGTTLASTPRANTIECTVVATATPGNLVIDFQAETTGTVTTKAGSYYTISTN